ncbi:MULTISPECIES: MetQ/NlpA family lipoprotein [Burkholderia cepacia complex]|uniref:MetQ/NlpA family lipoprotein n=1 Tax=Burkholderia cepacia complex TaxID=87882 RepID=UPI000A7C7DF1|nr:metal ABC transporter substrate-binding protein [Burkholderia cenocepacia]CAG2311925.1 metal ABC transporter substrate-binding protein [Burkholderia cenocepacia]CAG2311989.1 metal ABC transporter substrate-binding protein [Burkholderia cenocepacia]CAG2312014.1 metal ABC transporter substrate-binding protein [Burkholderia cenocepacia]CAG2312015.1 metal ABC transporter substrate-binding protein [Burkholderia cenocepacia]
MTAGIGRFVSAWLLAACAVMQQGSAMAAEAAARAAPAVRVGVTRGVHAQILDEVKKVAAARGLGVDVVEFDDASRIDTALADGRIDAASFEDAQRLSATLAAKGYALTAVAPTVTLPMAFYSRKLKNLNELQPGATVALPADPRGMARALVLLQNDTLVTLREKAGLHATLRDVTGNRLALKFATLRRDRLYAALDTAAFVAIDSDDAARAGLQPARDSISLEDARSPYANVLTVRDTDRAKPWVAQLVAAYHSDDVARFILTRYQDSVRRPW